MNFNAPFIKSNINKFKVKSEKKSTLTLMGKVLMFLIVIIKKMNTLFQKTNYDRNRARILNKPNLWYKP